MKKIFLIVASVFLCTNTYAQTTDWAYAGENGPQQWGHLNKSFAQCSNGKEQSPINIISRSTKMVKKPLPLNFDYSFRRVGLTETLDGKTNLPINGRPFTFEDKYGLQVNVTDPSKNSNLIWQGKKYHLIQFHFHAPNEHFINGKKHKLEIHFVHQDESTGNLVVVGVFVDKGAANPSLEAIIKAAPNSINHDNTLLNTLLSVPQLIPSNSIYYNYQGSLTTPPCMEPITWLVMAKPIHASKKQIVALKHILAENVRPLQPLNGRTVTQYRE